MRPETLMFAASGWVPNHPFLPVLVYRAALDDADKAAEFGNRFSAAGWTGIWHNGIFSYQHYHTGAHEALGIAAGEAEVLIGGEGGRTLAVGAGDCLVLPAGIGHRRISASGDFLVVGAYPPGQEADIRTGAATPEQLERIARLLLPESDPLFGRDGPLPEIWSRAAGERQA